MKDILPILILFIYSLATYFLARWLTGLARELALRRGVLAHVDHRSSHTIPTPRLGGVGLILAFLLTSTVYTLRALVRSEALLLDLSMLRWLTGGLLLIFIVGLLDDVYDLPPLVKLSLTIISVAIPTFGGYIVFPAFDHLGLTTFVTYLLNAGLSAFWLIFFINAFNFMDGMDGFAAGFARLVSFFFFLLFLRALFDLVDGEPNADCYVFLPFLLAACWGFLHWNNPPAKVFMGDGGAFSIGYLLAIYVILGARLNPSFMPPPSDECVSPLSSLTVLLPFIFDVVLTLIRRSLRGENILKAHREHLYQRLMKTGLSHAEVLRLTKKRFWLCGLAALAGAIPAHPAARWAGFIFALAVMLQYWRLTLARERPATS